MIPLTLAKQHLEYEDEDRDDLIEQYIGAAAAWVEGYTGLLLTRRAVTRRYSASGTDAFDLHIGPDPAINAITYLDSALTEQTIDAEDFVLADGRVYLVGAFPNTRGGLSVTITAGYADGQVPSDLISAQLLLIGHWFSNRETVVTGTIATSIPFGAEALCAPYRNVLV